MNKYDDIIKYLNYLESDNFGEWILDKESKGTLENPIQMPFVAYSDIVYKFEEDVYSFECSNKDMELTNYSTILKGNGIEWSTESMEAADLSALDDKCIMVLIIGAIRAEQFCDGALLNFFKNWIYINIWEVTMIRKYEAKDLAQIMQI
ncbi:MAG: DUF6508 domain-containing protein [Erysipelotrichaceae bacterium]|uniref:DUF6508 domain-containing protein n=1 Tax=Anaerorhabdus sp. TaxID=1872524 RepID=UPI002FC6244B